MSKKMNAVLSSQQYEIQTEGFDTDGDGSPEQINNEVYNSTGSYQEGELTSPAVSKHRRGVKVGG